MNQVQNQQQMNPMQILQMASKSQNPMQLVQQQMSKNPAFKPYMDAMPRVQEMLNGKNPQEQEQTFRNLCNSMGINADQMISQFTGQPMNQQMQNNQQIQSQMR